MWVQKSIPTRFTSRCRRKISIRHRRTRAISNKKPRRSGACFAASLCLGDVRVHEIVELLFFDAEPFLLGCEKRLPRLVYFFEFRIACRFLGIKLLRRLVAGLQYLAREEAKLDSVCDQTL